jgi:hypothetical protein
MTNTEKEIERADRFGFLPLKWTIEFDDGKVYPVAEFDSAWERVQKFLHEDGFLYPPTSQMVRFDFDSGKIIGRVPKTKRPKLLHPVPPSHELYLSCPGTTEMLRNSSAAFVIHFLGYLFDVRLQFYDWWFDNRIPIGQACDTRLSPSKASQLLSQAYRIWNRWPLDEQRRFTNILYMRSRVPSYEWDWERFMMEYTVIDGCWKMAEVHFGLSGLGLKKSPKHEDRIRILCEKFSIPFEEHHLTKIATLRNDLFHETLWSKGRPCSADDVSAFRMTFELRRLSKEFIATLVRK